MKHTDVLIPPNVEDFTQRNIAMATHSYTHTLCLSGTASGQIHANEVIHTTEVFFHNRHTVPYENYLDWYAACFNINNRHRQNATV